MSAPWQLVIVAGGAALLLALAVAWLIRAWREGDPGRLSDGWMRNQASDDNKDDTKR